ncbi:MAG TPA: tRNA pseudouridine(38-40) synthase TruA [Acidimicrobiia bacterium]|nr:tRNA pseudouridine(38-40) synthase TruA [Acidimicrobiia bacterium]
MTVYRIDLGYDGTAFRGFARQAGQRTVQGVLEERLARVLGGEVTTTGAGRTDAGVHARRQVVSFQWADDLDLARLARSLNGMMGPEVVVVSVEKAVDDFNARFSARWRLYRYLVLNAPLADPLNRHFCWHVAEPLDLTAMNDAAKRVVGEHDFASFCRTPQNGSTTRRVLSAAWAIEGEMTVFTISANAFCHQMVRSIVGFMVDVGKGRRRAEEIETVLAARDRSRASNMAPPHGLILWDVGY